MSEFACGHGRGVTLTMGVTTSGSDESVAGWSGGISVVVGGGVPRSGSGERTEKTIAASARIETRINGVAFCMAERCEKCRQFGNAEIRRATSNASSAKIFEKSGLQSLVRSGDFAPRVFGNARVAELVDALDSGSSGGNPVQVRVLSRAPFHFQQVLTPKGYRRSGILRAAFCRHRPLEHGLGHLPQRLLRSWWKHG